MKRLNEYEVFPGWVLYANYYMIVRNEIKFQSRNKSKRNQFEIQIIRPEIIRMVWNARCWLAMKQMTGEQYLNLKTFEIGDQPNEDSIALKEENWSETFDDSHVFLEKEVVFCRMFYDRYREWERIC